MATKKWVRVELPSLSVSLIGKGSSRGRQLQLWLQWSAWRLHGCQLICGWSIQFEGFAPRFFTGYTLQGTLSLFLSLSLPVSVASSLAAAAATAWQLNLLALYGFVWRIIGHWFRAALTHVSRGGWESPRTAQRTRFNYSQLFKLHLKWSIWGRSSIKRGRTFFLPDVCRTSFPPLYLSLSHSLSLLPPHLFKILLLKCCTNFVRFLTGKAWIQTLLVCEYSNNSHTLTHTHSRTACAHLKTLVKDSYRIRTLIKKFLMQIKNV